MFVVTGTWQTTAVPRRRVDVAVNVKDIQGVSDECEHVADS